MQTLTENITISLDSNNNSSAFPVKEQSAFFLNITKNTLCKIYCWQMLLQQHHSLYTVQATVQTFPYKYVYVHIMNEAQL